MHIAHRMQQLARLLHQRRAHRRIRVPQPGDAKRRREIEKAIPIRVPHIHALRPLPENGEVVREKRDISRLVPAQLFGENPRARAGDGGEELREHGLVFSVQARRGF